MITSNCKQKENKPKEVSLLRHGVARYVLAMKKTKNAAHNGVQADRSSLWCRALCPHVHCRTQLLPELIPLRFPQWCGGRSGICFEQLDQNPCNSKLSFICK